MSRTTTRKAVVTRGRTVDRSVAPTLEASRTMGELNKLETRSDSVKLAEKVPALGQLPSRKSQENVSSSGSSSSSSGATNQHKVSNTFGYFLQFSQPSLWLSVWY